MSDSSVIRAIGAALDKASVDVGKATQSVRSALKRCDAMEKPTVATGPRPEYLLHKKKTERN